MGCLQKTPPSPSAARVGRQGHRPSSRRGIAHPWSGAERAKRSGELHKRSAEAWGDRLRSPASSRDSALTAPGAKPLRFVSFCQEVLLVLRLEGSNKCYDQLLEEFGSTRPATEFRRVVSD